MNVEAVALSWCHLHRLPLPAHHLLYQSLSLCSKRQQSKLELECLDASQTTVVTFRPILATRPSHCLLLHTAPHHLPFLLQRTLGTFYRR